MSFLYYCTALLLSSAQGRGEPPASSFSTATVRSSDDPLPTSTAEIFEKFHDQFPVSLSLIAGQAAARNWTDVVLQPAGLEPRARRSFNFRGLLADSIIGTDEDHDAQQSRSLARDSAGGTRRRALLSTSSSSKAGVKNTTLSSDTCPEEPRFFFVNETSKPPGKRVIRMLTIEPVLPMISWDNQRGAYVGYLADLLAQLSHDLEFEFRIVNKRLVAPPGGGPSEIKVDRLGHDVNQYCPPLTAEACRHVASFFGLQMGGSTTTGSSYPGHNQPPKGCYTFYNQATRSEATDTVAYFFAGGTTAEMAATDIPHQQPIISPPAVVRLQYCGKGPVMPTGGGERLHLGRDLPLQIDMQNDPVSGEPLEVQKLPQLFLGYDGFRNLPVLKNETGLDSYAWDTIIPMVARGEADATWADHWLKASRQNLGVRWSHGYVEKGAGLVVRRSASEDSAWDKMLLYSRPFSPAVCVGAGTELAYWERGRRFQVSAACRICGVHVTVSCRECTAHVGYVICQICGVMSDLLSVVSAAQCHFTDAQVLTE